MRWTRPASVHRPCPSHAEILLDGSPLSNACTGQRDTLKFLAEVLCPLTGRQVEPVFAHTQTRNVEHSRAPVDTCMSELGVAQLTAFQEGLASPVGLIR